MASDDEGWDIGRAVEFLQGAMDPYLWEQGEELYSRGAVEDFAVQASGEIQVRILDPRDARIFQVVVLRDPRGRVIARCPCPYRLGSHCRHQVAALRYLKAVSEGTPTPGDVEAASAEEDETDDTPILYRLFDAGGDVTTTEDGSLLRAVLHEVGSSRAPYRVSLQLFTGKGWTELRTGDLERWIRRGRRGPHPRDDALGRVFVEEGSVRTQIDAERFARVLCLLVGSGALVTRGGVSIVVSHEPARLTARVDPGEAGGVAVELRCEGPGFSTPFDEVSLVPAAAPWVQVESGAFHPLVAGVGGVLLEELQEADLGAIDESELDRFLTSGLAALRRLCVDGVETAEGLIREVEGVRGARLRLDGDPQRLTGRLELAYGSESSREWVEAPETPEPWSTERDGRIVRYPPAGQSMERARRELGEIGFRREDGMWVIDGPGVLARVLEPRERRFVVLVLPERLRALDLSDSPPRLRLQVGRRFGGPPSSPLGKEPVGSGAPLRATDWFDIDVRLVHEGRELDVDLGEICRAAAERPGGRLQLDDGSVLDLGGAAVRELLELAERGESAPEGQGGSPRVRVGFAGVTELLEDAPGRDVELTGEAREALAALRVDGELEEAPVEERLAGILRPYQRAAVDWMGHLGRYGLGGVLADEMGLGKTLMSLTHLFGRDDQRVDEGALPVLVVCPTSLIFNWIDECRRFCPGVDVVGVQGLSPAEREKVIAESGGLIVTSYALLRRDREALEAREFRAVVLDEGQHIKNPESQTAQAAFAIHARERWVLTGTPVENHLLELWSLFHFLLPGFLGAASEFRSEFADPLRKGDDEPLGRLRARVRPFLLRRTKAQVLSDLPPRIEQIERVPLAPGQREVYESWLARVRAELEDAESARDRFKVLSALTRLRQICCHPRLVLGDEAGRGIASAKFELLLELLDECAEEGHRVLVFSQFTSVLDLIEEKLDERGIVRCRLDGSTKDREGVVRRFTQDDDVPVFLISLKAGGHGLNLTAADTVILFDPWWNPAVEEQAAARAHRMGQTLPVHVHKLITAGTVEEKIVELQAAKKELAESVVSSDEEAAGALGLEQLRAILYD